MPDESRQDDDHRTRVSGTERLDRAGEGASGSETGEGIMKAGVGEGQVTRERAALEAAEVDLVHEREQLATQVTDERDGTRTQTTEEEAITTDMAEAPLEPELAALLEDLEIYDMSLQVQALEGEIERLETIIIPTLESQVHDVEQVEREVEALFAGAYKHPERAKTLYDQVAILKGQAEAQRRLAETPGDFGPLKGGSLLRPRQRRDVERALGELFHRGAAYHRTLEAAERSGLRDGDLFAYDGSHGNEQDGITPSDSPVREIAETKRDAFDRALERLYVNADSARANLERVERRLGTSRAADSLVANPEGLGQVRKALPAAVREQYAREAALAGINLRRAREQTDRTAPEDYTGIEAARGRVRRLRAEVDELNQRIRKYATARGLEHEPSVAEQRKSIEARLKGLEGAQLDRLHRALERNQRRTQAPATKRGGRTAGGSPRRSTAAGRVRDTTSTRAPVRGGAAWMIAAQLAERAIRRTGEEVGGRYMWGR